MDKEMKQYTGTKTVKAMPMTMGEAYERKLLKEGVRPSECETDKAGYLVEYDAGMAVRRGGWNGKGLFVVKQVPSRITADIIPNMQSLPQSAKDIIMARKEPHIDYSNQMLIINPDGRADSWVPSSSDVFAEDWELVTV